MYDSDLELLQHLTPCQMQMVSHAILLLQLFLMQFFNLLYFRGIELKVIKNPNMILD